MTPMNCPRCRWLGTTEEECPACGALVQPLRKNGLDSLRREYGLLNKASYWRDAKPGERVERQGQIKRLFDQIGQPIA